jgi:hypothetical protein
MHEAQEWIRAVLPEIELTEVLVAYFCKTLDRCWGFNVENEQRDP